MRALPETESNLAVTPSHLDQIHRANDAQAVIILKRLADRAQARLNEY
jgi:hypothetical protein